jgi:hypothetical protein
MLCSPVEIGGVREHLGHHRSASFRVGCELDLDDNWSPADFDADQVRVAVPESDLSADDHQAR